jgi:hypothetical protein
MLFPCLSSILFTTQKLLFAPSILNSHLKFEIHFKIVFDENYRQIQTLLGSILFVLQIIMSLGLDKLQQTTKGKKRKLRFGPQIAAKSKGK